jgi:cathepsin X
LLCCVLTCQPSLCVFCREQYDLYGADEFGSVTGEEEMMAEIYARGPISCSLNSDVLAFDQYR